MRILCEQIIVHEVCSDYANIPKAYIHQTIKSKFCNCLQTRRQ